MKTKKFFLVALFAIVMILPTAIKAGDVICKLPGGNVEIQSEYMDEDCYVVTVMNDSDTDNANIEITIEYTISNSKDKKNASVRGIAYKATTTPFTIKCDPQATNIKITSIKGTKCQ